MDLNLIRIYFLKPPWNSFPIWIYFWYFPEHILQIYNGIDFQFTYEIFPVFFIQINKRDLISLA